MVQTNKNLLKEDCKRSLKIYIIEYNIMFVVFVSFKTDCLDA